MTTNANEWTTEELIDLLKSRAETQEEPLNQEDYTKLLAVLRRFEEKLIPVRLDKIPLGRGPIRL